MKNTSQLALLVFLAASFAVPAAENVEPASVGNIVTTPAKPAVVQFSVAQCPDAALCGVLVRLKNVEFSSGATALRITAVAENGSQVVDSQVIYKSDYGDSRRGAPRSYALNFPPLVGGDARGTLSLRIEPISYGREVRTDERTVIGRISVEQSPATGAYSAAR